MMGLPTCQPVTPSNSMELSPTKAPRTFAPLSPSITLPRESNSQNKAAPSAGAPLSTAGGQYHMNGLTHGERGVKVTQHSQTKGDRATAEKAAARPGRRSIKLTMFAHKARIAADIRIFGKCLKEK